MLYFLRAKESVCKATCAQAVETGTALRQGLMAQQELTGTILDTEQENNNKH